MEGTTAVDGGELMGINPNMGDSVRKPALTDALELVRLTRRDRLLTRTTATRGLSARPTRAVTRPMVTASLRRLAFAKHLDVYSFTDLYIVEWSKVLLVRNCKLVTVPFVLSSGGCQRRH